MAGGAGGLLRSDGRLWVAAGVYVQHLPEAFERRIRMEPRIGLGGLRIRGADGGGVLAAAGPLARPVRAAPGDSALHGGLRRDVCVARLPESTAGASVRGFRTAGHGGERHDADPK